jgi:hypothetical protein
MKNLACWKRKRVRTWKVMAVLPATRPTSMSLCEIRPSNTDR